MATTTSSRQQERMLKKHRQLSGYDSSSPEDEEEDETFVTLQKLLKALDTTRLPTQTETESSIPSSRRMGTTTSMSLDQPRLSQEEMLEERRQERERFRHMLFASKRVRRRRPTYYVQSEDDEEEEEPVPSVESAISNRVISGSFSRLHVISRDRWAHEEAERLPIVLLPKNGKIVSPAENPKLNVCHTNEYEVLQDQLMDQLKTMPEMTDHSRLLTPPQSTWYMQMRKMDAIHC